jgi:DNA-3-methyladenine glycosylase
VVPDSLTRNPSIAPSWLARPAPDVAPELIGCTLVRQLPDGTQIRGLIVEVEAYAPGDPAFHAYRSRTARNWILFEAPGYSYVYLIYGIYHCFNIVTDVAGVPSAVLVRALHLQSIPPDLAVTPTKQKQLQRLAAGPGKLCRSLQIDLTHNALELKPGNPLWLEHRSSEFQSLLASQPQLMVQTTRIGLTKGIEIPWRWYFYSSPSVSKR